MHTPSIAAIVCTYNRPKMLHACISALLSQDREIAEIIVVDNAPTQVSIRELEQYPSSVTHMKMQENLGPAGGFAAGMRAAYSNGHDYLWLFNDDAAPESSALRECLVRTNELTDEGGVVTHDAIKTTATHPERVTIFNFNGALVSRSVVAAVGYPRAEFFMCYEEHDYSYRITKAGLPIISIPSGHVRHELAGTVDGRTPPWRGYYQTRNELAAALSHRSARQVARWFVRQVKFFRGALLGGDQVLLRLRYRLLGTWHAVRGITGRTVEPTQTGGN